MAVERDRFYGAAIAASGAPEAHAGWIRALTAALAAVDWPALRRHAAIAVVDPRADARFGQASCVLDPMTPVIAERLGLPGGAAELGTDPAAVAQRRWHTAITRALDLARVPYAIVDESASESDLAGYRAVIAPTVARIDRGLALTLRALVEHKRAIVVIGPGTPSHDELGQPLGDDALPRRVGRLKAGSLDDVPGLAADLAALAGEPSDAWQIERPDEVHAYAHCDSEPGGEVRVLFVASDARRPVTAVVLVPAQTEGGARALRDPFSHERIVVADGRAAVDLAARGVRMLIVERAGAPTGPGRDPG
jgi:hypothetical protein